MILCPCYNAFAGGEKGTGHESSVLSNGCRITLEAPHSLSDPGISSAVVEGKHLM